MKKMQKLSGLGQAVWFDNISRSFIEKGELKALIDDGLRGVTSNPTIFEKSITGSTDYDRDLKKLVSEGKSAAGIYESLENPSYPDTLYVDNLIGDDTVNTLLPSTLDAFVDHGTVARTIDEGVEEAQKQLSTLSDLGIDLNAVTQKLQDDGVA